MVAESPDDSTVQPATSGAPSAVGPTAAPPRRPPPQNPTRRLRGRALAILGLASVAVVQPLLDLFGRNPEFFVAGNYGSAQIVVFAVLTAVVPAAVGIAVVALASALHRRAGDLAFHIVAAIFAFGLVLAVLRVLGLDPAALVVPLAVVGAVGLMWLIVRVAGFGMLATYLAAANLLFVGMFLFASPASKLVTGAGAGDVGRIDVGEVNGPVIVIVLDEFPVASLLRPDGTINAERYPGFAELAGASTWFRNASSLQNLTHRAVPAILTGTRAAGDVLPIAADYPRTMFSFFGAELPVHRYESVTDMCPASVCEQQASQGFGRLVEDAGIVYGHRVLPAELRDRLPAIDNSWGAFGAQEDRGTGVAADGSSAADDPPADDPSADDPSAGGDGAAASEPADPRTEQQIVNEAYRRWHSLDADEKSPVGQARILAERIALIDGEPDFHFIHPALPHRPWILSRTGVTTSFLPEIVHDDDNPSRAFQNRMEFQFSAMQIGAADALMSDLLEHLRALPTWEDTLLVVTSDHGTSLTPPNMGRMRVNDANRDEALRVPLFIKAPGQTTGAIDDRVALTSDVLPSMIDLLGGSADWDFEGHSLYDGSEPSLEPRVSPEVDALIEIARRRSEDFPHGLDWTALAAVGDDGDLVGRALDDVTLGEPSAITIDWAQEDEFASLPTSEGSMPFGLRGTVRSGGETPPELLVAVNGTLAGVIGGYVPDGSDRWTFIGFVADFYVEGPNTVDAYEVTRAADGTPTLHLVARS